MSWHASTLQQPPLALEAFFVVVNCLSASYRVLLEAERSELRSDEDPLRACLDFPRRKGWR